MLTLRDTVTERVLSASSATPVHVTESASNKSDESAKEAAKTEDKPGDGRPSRAAHD